MHRLQIADQPHVLMSVGFCFSGQAGPREAGRAVKREYWVN